MSQSLAKLYVHAIFSTKNRIAFLKPDIRARVFSHMATTLQNLNCPPIEIGGISDHVHVLCTQSKSIAAEDLVKEMKVPTSKFVKEIDPSLHDFHWQGGYSVFSVSPSNLQKVREYIVNQETHHKKESFQDEFRRFLKKYEIPYDERYVWD